MVMITFPPASVRALGEDGIKRLSWSVDASLELKGFAGERPRPMTQHAQVKFLTGRR